MNGILCAYLRATDAEHAERRGDRVAAALDRQLHDVLGIEVRRVRRERRAGGMLDALVDRQDRDVAGAARAGRCRTADCRPPSTRGGRSDAAYDAVDEVRTRQVQAVLRDRPALVLQQRCVAAEKRLDSAQSFARCNSTCCGHV